VARTLSRMLLMLVTQIRSVYRLVEFAMGIHGYPFTHEWMFYVLESLPMLPAILVFCVYHPAKYFASQRRRKVISDLQLGSSDGTPPENV
jgi:hypothetical protein